MDATGAKAVTIEGSEMKKNVVTASPSSDTQALDALTGGAFSAPTSGDRAARVREWLASDHIDELGFSPEARASMAKAAGVNAARGSFDALHINSATYVGPNKWFDAGDQRFAPNNVIISSREASFVAIVARDGKIVWRLGPDFNATPEMRAIRQMIGQHHAHFIPKGLPGAGNVMIFDNGGASGYGAPNSNAPNGTGLFARPTSRVLEIDPVTLKLVWNYTATTFFATNISGAQRLPNGNTVITAYHASSGKTKLFEVTREPPINVPSTKRVPVAAVPVIVTLPEPVDEIFVD